MNRKKLKLLENSGTLNLKPNLVKDELFLQNKFFDPFDLLQIKYEILRHVKIDGWSITKATTTFGLSRQAFYKLENDFKLGLYGLFPKKRGPQKPSKLAAEVIKFIKQKRQDDKMSWIEVQLAIKKQFNLLLHIRTMQKSISQSKKKIWRYTEPTLFYTQQTGLWRFEKYCYKFIKFFSYK